MKILVLSGEVTHQRPMSYGFPHEWSVQVLELVDPEYLTLCEKYEGAKHVSLPETLSFLKRAYQCSLTEIQAREYDVIVGVGYGAHVLSNMVAAYEWRGPSVFIFSEGSSRLHFVSRPPLDEIGFDTRPIRSVLVSIVSKNARRSAVKAGQQGKKSAAHDKEDVVQIVLREEDWQRNLYAAGLLSNSVNILTSR